VDWNNDGKKDLLTGERNGFIRIYLNTNTDANPVFNGYTFLQVNNQKFDCGYNSNFYVIDWNNDDKKDVICSEEEGKFFLLINEGTDEDPVFNSKPFIQNNGSVLDVGWRPSPSIVDWNGDGKKDLLTGCMPGNVMYFENKGTDAAPVFNGSVNLKSGNTVIDLGWDDQPWVTDFNGDGTWDILAGEYDGFVYYVEGIGPMALSQNRIESTVGGSVDFTLDAGLANSGRNYLVLGSLSGTAPGMPLPGGQVTLPVNWDIFTQVVFSMINTPAFADFMGVLDANGTAVATFDTISAVPDLAGLNLYFAFGLNAPWDFVSNGAAIEIVP